MRVRFNIIGTSTTRRRFGDNVHLSLVLSYPEVASGEYMHCKEIKLLLTVTSLGVKGVE